MEDKTIVSAESESEKIPAVRPLELRYTPILDPYRNEVWAYRTTTVVYSQTLGTLTENDYTYAADYGNDTGVRLSEWNIGEAMRHIARFEEAGAKVQFVTARCTASFAMQTNAYDIVKALLVRIGLKNPASLCLEFPQSVLYLAGDQARKTVLDMKLLGVRTMVSGCGAADCPVSMFLQVPVDFVLLEPTTTALIRDRNKPGVLAKFVQYLRSMNLKVIAEGALTDNEFRELARMDCVAVITAHEYQGNCEGSDGDLTVEEAIAQKGAD